MPRVPSDDLSLRLIATLGEACLKGRFENIEASEQEYDYCICIGNECKVSAKTTIYAWSSGWRCFVSKDKLGTYSASRRRVNSCSCLATAALAVMMLYYDAEGLYEPLHTDDILGWSLLDYCVGPDDGPDLPDSIPLGRIVQAGLGGTGNALLWALRQGPELLGNWDGFEHEMLDLSNANRYLLMGALETGSKAVLAQQRFGAVHAGLHFQAVQARVEVACPGLLDAHMVLATVDDPQIRVDLQRRGANLILNVGTNSQWISMSRHDVSTIRAGGPCVGCFYGSNEQAPRRARESTVSFVVALLGAVLGGELLKSYCFPEYVLTNSWVANIFAPAQGRMFLRPSVPNCDICLAIRC